MKKIRVFCFDLGDTIMQEATEIKDFTRTTQRADLFPGIKEALHDLEKMGYTLALVADTRPGTYKNVLTMHGLYDLFSVFSISEELGTEKPDPRMFQYVLDKLGVLPEETVMCGNNLKKDIAGANKMGMTTVWFHWNDRYDTTPRTELEHPDYTVRSAKDLIDLVKRLT